MDTCVRWSAWPALVFCLMGSSAAARPTDVRLGAPERSGSFEIYPVLGTKTIPAADYLLLADGLKRKEVEILERKGSGRVPELILHNRSSKPLYLVSGEVVYGGKQDRVIRDDTIIPPLSMNVSLSVYCVERGRWRGGRSFDKVGGFAPMAVTKAANFARQGDVWKAVRKEADKAGKSDPTALSSTGTVQSVLKSKTIARKAAPLFKVAKRIFARGALPIGFVVAIAGKPRAAHIFGSPGLAMRLGHKLLRTYALDAARGKDTAGRAPRKSIQRFLAEAMKERGKRVRDFAQGMNLLFSGNLGKGKVAIDKKSQRTLHRAYYAH